MNRTHVFIIDGTLSRLAPGQETNAGLLYKLLCKLPSSDDLTVGYDPGVQGYGLMKWVDVITGRGINQSIQAGYRELCTLYQPGDRILLFGFSRGAYAVRSIAGMIATVGLLRARFANDHRITKAFNYYQLEHLSKRAKAFVRAYTHPDRVEIEMIGVWDTVKALGVPLPLLSRLTPMATEFHNHDLSPVIRNAFQALAADENRTAFAPIVWTCQPNWHGRLEQAWFPGAHSDVGGHIYDLPQYRPLANLSLNWMLERADECGLPLPEGWRSMFETDACGAMQGAYLGSSKYFLFRKNRRFGSPKTDFVHPSILERESRMPKYKSRLSGRPV